MKELSEYKFKKEIWNNVKYFKKIYIPNDEFFKPKINQVKYSDQFYIEKKHLDKWANIIADKYNPWNDNRELLLKDLLEKRKGQYSNGTLFSSSRLIAEIFYMDENRIKLLKWLNLDNMLSINDLNWTLEYRLPIFNDKEKHPAQLDLAVWNEDIFIGIESKMKEIYKKNYINEFELIYRNGKNDLLKEFEQEFNINLNDNKTKYLMTYDGLENNNFYYKQQICHLLGMRRNQSKSHETRKYVFLNFVFDVSDVPGMADVSGANDRYKQNEIIIGNIMKNHFNKTNIEYKGLLTQKELFKIV